MVIYKLCNINPEIMVIYSNTALLCDIAILSYNIMLFGILGVVSV
jgi:hypothetical protein